MDQKTAEALEKSIEKWMRNAKAINPDVSEVGVGTCPLCDLYIYGEDPCEGCPVMVKTGFWSCIGTPYANAYRAYQNWALHPNDASCEAAFKRLSLEEAEFLKGLRDG